MPLVYVSASEKAVLEALVDTGGLLDGVKMGLIANDIIPTRETLWEDIEQPTFAGYALSSAITWSAPVLGADGFWRVIGSTKTFLSTDPFTDPATIYGFFIVSGAGSILIAAERYESPRYISEADQAIVEVPQVGAVTQYGA